MTALPRIAVIVLGTTLTWSSAGAADPARLTLAIDPVGASLDLGTTTSGRRLPLPGGTVAFTLAAYDAATATAEIATAVLGPLGDLLPPVPVVVAGVPVCLRLRPEHGFGHTNLASGAIDVALPGAVDVYVTSLDEVCPTCADGACRGHTLAGVPCRVEAMAAVGMTPLALSRDCPPLGVPAATMPMSLALTTGEVDADLPCDPPLVPAAGATAIPEPAWPLPDLPKHAAVTLVGAACVAATGLHTMDALYGLPGPAAVRMPAAAVWEAAPAEDASATLEVQARAVRVRCALARDSARGAICEAVGIVRLDDGTPVRATPARQRAFGRRTSVTAVLPLTRQARARLRTGGRLAVEVWAHVRPLVGPVPPLAAVGVVTLAR